MIKKKNNGYVPHEHLEHWVSKSTFADRFKWLDESFRVIKKLQKKKGYPSLSHRSE